MGSNYTVFVTNDQIKEAGDYYFGVFPSAHDNNMEPIRTTIDFTFDVFSTACYFWNETSSDWSSEGCRVSFSLLFYSTEKSNRYLNWCGFNNDMFMEPFCINVDRKLIAKRKADYSGILVLHFLGKNHSDTHMLLIPFEQLSN